MSLTTPLFPEWADLQERDYHEREARANSDDDDRRISDRRRTLIASRAVKHENENHAGDGDPNPGVR